MSERATERDEWTDEVIVELEAAAEALPGGLGEHYRRLAEQGRRLRAASTDAPEGRTDDDLACAIRMVKALKRDADRDGDIPRLQLRLREITNLLEVGRIQGADAAPDRGGEEDSRFMNPERQRAIAAVVSDARWLVDTARKMRGRGMDDIWDGIEDLRKSLAWLDRACQSEPGCDEEDGVKRR